MPTHAFILTSGGRDIAVRIDAPAHCARAAVYVPGVGIECETHGIEVGWDAAPKKIRSIADSRGGTAFPAETFHTAHRRVSLNVRAFTQL